MFMLPLLQVKNVIFEELVEVIRNIQVEDVLICDDFNCVLDNELDVISGGKDAVNSVKKCNEILSDFDLYDTWRQQGFYMVKKNPICS